jgi:hypothetical protein
MLHPRIWLTIPVAALMSTIGLASVVRADPAADQVLTDLGFSTADKQLVLKGEFVTAKLGAVSERDLSFAIAFLVKTSPESLSKEVIAGKLIGADSQVQAYGLLSEAGSAADFSELRMTDDEARALVNGEAAEDVNFSPDEHAALRARRGDSTEAVRAQLERLLLARYQSYRASGLAGVAPYDRGKGRVSDVASDLANASRGAERLHRYLPALQTVLLDYPRAALAGLEQRFLWLKSVIRGKPTYVLAQLLAAGDGDTRVVVRREFYVSSMYNAEQSIASFFPVEGGTVVVCMSHAFTDQVAGASGSMKRSLGSRVMAGQMKEIFDKGRKNFDGAQAAR